MVHFFEKLLGKLPPLIFDFAKMRQRKVIILTDASFNAARAGLGVILFDSESKERYVVSKRMPAWLLR